MYGSEHNGAYISQPICTNKLIFSKRVFFFLLFLNMRTNLIISQILIFVTSHFSIVLATFNSHQKFPGVKNLFPLK